MNFLNLSLRIRLPLFSDAFTCRCIGRQFTTSSVVSAGENKDYEINPDFVNRNPRNLEHLGYARKRQGWIFQSPSKHYYNKLILERTNFHITGQVVHWTGVTVVSASTKEVAIKKHLYSTRDVAAAMNIGSILAHRCLQAGITNVFYDYKDEHSKGEMVTAFLNAFKEGCVKIGEPRVIFPYYKPGIDYDGPHRLGGEDKDQPMKEDYQF